MTELLPNVSRADNSTQLAEAEIEELDADDVEIYEGSGVVAIESDDPDDDSSTMRVGAYSLIAEIARGGMGIVYLCRRAGEAGFQRLFALKVMHAHLANDVDFVTMLLDEGHLAARIHHHNVVSVVDLGVNDHGHFLVMDYVEGCSLAQLLGRNRGHRPPQLIVPIIVGSLNGLHAAHILEDDTGNLLGLAHRDVSPQNILIGVDGDARITDFGVARARARLTQTEPGLLKGKLAYTAPELLDGTTTADHRVDIFAMGAVLWSALTGKALFRGESQAEIVTKLLHLDIPAPSSVGLRPPECFDAICLKALARDPAQRFESAAEMADALRQAAVNNKLLGAPTRVAHWVRETFADELSARRDVIRRAVSERPAKLDGLPTLPQIASDSEREFIAITPTTAANQVGPTLTPADELSSAQMELAGPPLGLLLLAMVVAFLAGVSLVMLLRSAGCAA